MQLMREKYAINKKMAQVFKQVLKDPNWFKSSDLDLMKLQSSDCQTTKMYNDLIQIPF